MRPLHKTDTGEVYAGHVRIGSIERHENGSGQFTFHGQLVTGENCYSGSQEGVLEVMRERIRGVAHAIISNTKA